MANDSEQFDPGGGPLTPSAPHPKNLPLALQIFRPPHKGEVKLARHAHFASGGASSV